VFSKNKSNEFILDKVHKMRKIVFVHRMVWEIIQGHIRRVMVCRGGILMTSRKAEISHFI